MPTPSIKSTIQNKLSCLQSEMKDLIARLSKKEGELDQAYHKRRKLEVNDDIDRLSLVERSLAKFPPLS